MRLGPEPSRTYPNSTVEQIIKRQDAISRKSVSHVEHTQHRSTTDGTANVLVVIVAYTFQQETSFGSVDEPNKSDQHFLAAITQTRIMPNSR